MRIQILDYQVGPHTFRMVKPFDFNIFKALPSLIPFIVYLCFKDYFLRRVYCRDERNQ